MRVLYVARSYGVHDRRFVDAWLHGGAEVRAVAGDGSAPGQSSGAADLSTSVQAAIREHRPDVVHAGPITDIAPVVAAEWSGPLLATSWGFDLMDDVDRDTGLRQAARAVMGRADVVHVDNDAPAEVARALGADPDGLVQFPWGIDLDRHRPGAGRLREELDWQDCTVVLCSRRHEDLYRVEDVVRAFLAAAPGTPDLRLLLAGSGSRTAALAAEIAGAGLSDRVHLAGDLGAERLADAYRSADLYVSTSATDGSSISLLEAMACGTAVCVTDIPGNRQWVGPETGQLVAVGDVAALTDRLREAADGSHGTVRARESRIAAAARLVARDADWSVNRDLLVAAGRLAVARAGERR